MIVSFYFIIIFIIFFYFDYFVLLLLLLSLLLLLLLLFLLLSLLLFYCPCDILGQWLCVIPGLILFGCPGLCIGYITFFDSFMWIYIDSSVCMKSRIWLCFMYNHVILCTWVQLNDMEVYLLVMDACFAWIECLVWIGSLEPILECQKTSKLLVTGGRTV